MAQYGSFRLYGSLSKVEDQEDGTIKVYGIASSGARDEAGEIILPDAMRAALPDYMKWGAIREMHQPSAAGTALEAHVDTEGYTQLVAHVVDAAAIQKVKTGVYKGFSVGGRVTGRDPKDPTIITSIKLIETSLVDRPCNPEAAINLWKADLSAAEEQDMTQTSEAAAETAGEAAEAVAKAAPTNDEVRAEAEALAKAAGKDGKWKDFVVKAREGLIAKGDAVEVEPVAEAAGEQDVVAAADEPIDPAEALTAALERAAKAGQIEAATTEAAQITVGLADTGKALVKLVEKLDGEPMAKGLWTVGSLARVIEELACIQSSTVWEAAAEGDDSPVPQQLAESIQALGATLVAMAQEEVAELITSLTDGGADLDVIFVDDDDDFIMASKLVDLVKADTGLMEKAGKRNSKADQEKVQTIHDHAQKLGAACDIGNCAKAADAEDLEKVTQERDKLAAASAAAVPQIEALSKRLDDQAREIELLKAQPMPPKAAASAHAVNKGADSAGVVDQAPTADDIAKAIAALPESERGDLLMRAALVKPSVAITARLSGRAAA